MSKTKKNLTFFLSSILITISLILTLYYVYFYPKVQLTPINKNISYTAIDIFKKFSLDDLSLSLKKQSIKSTITLNETDLTNLIITFLKKYPNLNKYIIGINVKIENSSINLDVNLKYKSIPFSSKFVFRVTSENGDAILHYEKGQVGVIPIPKKIIFSKLKNSSMIKIDENNDNIIVSLKDIKQLNIYNIVIKDNKIFITINASLNFK